MRVEVLGPLAVDGGDGGLGPRDRVVLSVLVLHGREVVGTERIADALWGAEPPPTANKVIQGCVSRLRKALGAASIGTLGTGYRLELGADDVDLHQFERLLGRAREQLALRTPDRALRTAEEALALWRGRPFENVEGWDAARFEAVRLEELKQEAEELRVDAALRAGRHHEILATARGLVDAAPTRERRWELLALAQYRSGSQADALRTLQRARRGLVEELGLDPGSGIVELEAAILRQDGELAGPTIAPVVDDDCPWPGLLAYAVDDADGFAGRQREVDACLARLREEGVLVVVGPSGSGKSSLVRAGVAAKLQRDGQGVTVITPGPRPADRLGGIAASDVLVVDQCEEVVTACEDAGQRQRFFDALVERAEWGPRLVVALRADRVGDLSAHAGFARLIERGLYLLGPMDEASLREAIDRPARSAGLLLEPGLVDLVVRDVLDEPGALPLMSHALQQTWTRREGRTLTVAGYTGTGGIRGAVAKTAEAVFAGVDPTEQAKLRDLLLRLVVPVEDGAPARIRLPHRAVAGDPAYQRLVDRLVAVRLLTTDGEVVEIAHEALTRAWPRFQDWLAEDADGARVLRHLNGAAAGWDALGRPDSELYRGERLAGVLAWRDRTGPALTALEAAFVEASVEHQRRELRTAEVQVGRLRRLVAGVAVLAAVALATSVVAFVQRDEADDQTRIAEARRIAAEALDARPHDRALLLALEAVRRWDDPETRGALLTTIGRSPRLDGVIRSEGSRFVNLDVSPTGDRVVASQRTGGITLHDLATGELVDSLATGEVERQTPAFSPGGSRIATIWLALDCGLLGFFVCASGVEVFDAEDLDAPPTRYEGLTTPPVDVTWSPDGRFLAASGPVRYAGDDSIAVWAVGSPERPLIRMEPDDLGIDLRPSPDLSTPGWMAFAPDGETLYASGAGAISVLDPTDGTVRREVDGLGGLALSPDGSTLAIRGTARTARLVDAATGAVRAELTGHADTITAAAFNEDGSMLATAGVDQDVLVWDATTGEQLLVLEGHSGTVTDVDFDSSGRVHTVASDRLLLAWDVVGGGGLARTVAGPSLELPGGTLVVVSPDGRRLWVASDAMNVIDLRTGDGHPLGVADGQSDWASFRGDGERVATVAEPGEVRLWRTANGELLARSSPEGDSLGGLAFAPDGSVVLVASTRGVLTELDGETLEPTGRRLTLDHPGGTAVQVAADGRFAVTSIVPDRPGIARISFGRLEDLQIEREVEVGVDASELRGAFHPDGRRYAFGGNDGRVVVIDVTTGELTGPADPVHSGPVVSLAFSPDGSTLATLGLDGVLTLSDPADARPRSRIVPGAVNRNGALAFTPDGRSIVVGYRDGAVVSFDPDPAAWVAHACAVAGRDLTAGEWRDAFGDEPRRSTC